MNGRKPLRQRLRAGSALTSLMLTACAVGPDYHAPNVAIPGQWQLDPSWIQAKPADHLERGRWWSVFRDAELDRLETELQEANPSLAVAMQHLSQAQAQSRAAAAAWWPQLGANAGTGRTGSSADRPLASYAVANSAVVQNDFNAGFTVHYEADLFGATRRQVEAASAGVQQAQADAANARLVLEAELAADYFSLRELDAEIGIVAHNITEQHAALEFVRKRHDLGVASGLDLAQAQAQLDSTVTQVDLLRNQRERTEHAIASLIGQTAVGFSLASAAADFSPPSVPLGVPADLLQRRPDVASAERTMAAANARIGIATAAYFPNIGLSAGLGSDANQLGRLFQAGSVLWSLGASAGTVLFDGGRISAGVDYAKADYAATVASYRAAVLTAMQEVQDGLTGTVTLGKAADEARASVRSARQVTALAQARYEGGLASYLDVISAEQAQLASERQQIQIDGQLRLVTVYLVKALGGGWQSTL